MFKVHTILLRTDPTSLLGIGGISFLLKYPRAAGTHLRVRASGIFPLYIFFVFFCLFYLPPHVSKDRRHATSRLRFRYFSSQVFLVFSPLRFAATLSILKLFGFGFIWRFFASDMREIVDAKGAYSIL